MEKLSRNCRDVKWLSGRKMAVDVLNRHPIYRGVQVKVFTILEKEGMTTMLQLQGGATSPSPVGSRKDTQLPVDDTQTGTSGSHVKRKRIEQKDSATVDISDADSPSDLRSTNGRADTSTSAGLGCRQEAVTDATTHRREEDHHNARATYVAEGSDQDGGEMGTALENGTQLRPKRKCELERGAVKRNESSGRMEQVSGASRVAADGFDETSVVHNRKGGEMEKDTVGGEDEKPAVGDEGKRRSERLTGDGVVQPEGHRSSGVVDIETRAEEEVTTGGRVGNVDACDAVKELEDEPDGGVSEYELQRLERIKRNQAFMDTLGLGASKPVVSLAGRSSRGGHPGVKRKKSARPAEERAAREPVRRSTRTRRNKSIDSSEDNRAPLVVFTPPAAAPELEPQPVLEEIDFDDSTVLKYLCSEANSDQAENGHGVGSSAAQEGARMVGVRPLGRDPPLSASGLSTIYSMHFQGRCGDSDGKSTSSALLAAGGKGGIVAIFSARQPVRPSGAGSPGNWSEPSEENDERTLMNFKAHNGWVSSVRFVGGSSGNDNGVGSSAIEACRLLSSANDSVVKLWDASKALRGMPRLLYTANELHPTRKGIFSMDSIGTRVVTGSKDATVGVASLRSTGIAAEQVLGESGGSEAFHTRVIKGVSLRDETTVASCGDDTNVCVSDLRASNSSGISFRLKGVHDGSCHTVRWHPRDENLLLTAGLDSTVKLFDLRRPDVPLHVFRGHCTSAFGSASSRRPKAIHRPEFMSSGKANFNVISCGEGSVKMSMYDVSSGAAVSRGTLRDEATALAVLGGNGSEEETVAAAMPGGDVLLLAPAWTADTS